MSLPQKHRLNKKPVPVNPLYRNFINTLEVATASKPNCAQYPPVHTRGYSPCPNNKKYRPIQVGIFVYPVQILESVFRRNGEFLAPVTTTCCEHAAAVGSGHTLAEAVFVTTLANRGLKCTFHIYRFLLLLFLGTAKVNSL